MATRLENHEMRAVTSLSGDYLRHDNVGDWSWTGLWSMTMVLFYLRTGVSIWTVGIAFVWLVGLYRTMNTRLYQLPADETGNIFLRVIRKNYFWKPGRTAFPKFMAMSEIVNVINEDGVSQALMPVGSNGTLEIVLKCEGSDMATAEPALVRRRLEAFGQALTTVQGIGLSFIYANRPSDPWVLADSYDRYMDPFVFIPPLEEEVDLDMSKAEIDRYKNL